MRRIGALLAIAEDDSERDARVGAFEHGLQQLGWTIGDNSRIDYRWATNDVERSQYAAELIDRIERIRDESAMGDIAAAAVHLR